MGENSKIEWTDHTFNPWIGCSKVSAACKNCYAEVETFTRVQRSKGRELWGIEAERHITSDQNWEKPDKWDKQAKAEGERRRVFCASLADVFEDRPDLLKPRLQLFDVIINTPHLDWLLLTKRTESILPILQASLALCAECQPEHADEKRGAVYQWLKAWISGDTPANVWLGTTAENQEEADRRIPHLLNVPARVRFLSCEPLLGPINLGQSLAGASQTIAGQRIKEWIDWVICGGESGPNARPMHPDWARSLRDQCNRAGVAFHFKQWGVWTEEMFSDEHAAIPDHRAFAFDDNVPMVRVRKHAAGRILDGRTWDEFPAALHVEDAA